MPIKCEEYNQVCVMSVEGDLSDAEVIAARAAFEERIEQRSIVDFVIDLEKTEFIDSEGMELLLSIKSRVEELFGQVKLAGPKENVQKILEITRLAHRFETHVDLTTALKTMRWEQAATNNDRGAVCRIPEPGTLP